MNKKVLFIDSVHEVLQHRLRAAGFVCEMHFKTPRNVLYNMLHEYAGIVIRSRISLDKEMIEAGTSLEFIARSGSGLENIDTTYAEKKGIAIINSPEGNRDAVGEQTIGMLLMLLNNLKNADNEVREGKWLRHENRGYEIAEKTVGIIGYGVMGSGLAEKLAGFNCKILAHDKYISDFSNAHVNEATLQEIFEHADILSIHLPLTIETTYYINDGFLSRFKKPIYFINTSRGKNVKTSSIANALRSGVLKGACLDVLEYEHASLEGLEFAGLPEDLKYLMHSPKVILTPHIAGWTHESYFKLSDVLADKILARFSG